MKHLLTISFVFLFALNNSYSQAKFTLTPEKNTAGKSNTISNCYSGESHFIFNQYSPTVEIGSNREDKEWNEIDYRLYNIKYSDGFQNFEIEEIATKRKIVFTKPTGEIVKGIYSIVLTPSQKLIGFKLELDYNNSNYTFFDIQTGKMLPKEINKTNFFSKDKFYIVQSKQSGKYNYEKRTYEETPGYVYDIEKEGVYFSFEGEFKKFNEDFSMFVTTKGIYSMADKAKIISLNGEASGFSDDLQYAFANKYLINLKLKSFAYTFDDFTVITSITNGRITCNYQDIQTHVYDLARVELYAAYKNEIDSDFARLKAKDEFETQDEYKARSVKEKDEILKKYENLFLEKTNTLMRKVADSYQQIELKIEKLDTYIPEKNQFPITINGITNLITIPRSDAKLFKESYQNAKITAIKQLDESGSFYRIFNIKIANPNTGVIYNFGEQTDPLYVEESSIAQNQSGIPKLDITAKLTEPSGNNLLDGNENATVDLLITNSGTGNAQDIRIKMTADSDISGLTFEKSNYLTGLAAGKEQVVKLQMNAARAISDGVANFTIEATEMKGFNPSPVKFQFNTQKFLNPQLVFRDVSIKEVTGNNNNIIENGEMIEANVLIQNIGQGVAKNTEAIFDFGGDNNIISFDVSLNNQQIGEILPGQDKTIKLQFAVNNKYTGGDVLPINVRLKEAYNEYGGNFPLNLELKKVTQAAKTISIDGEYAKVTVINEASLSSDVDKNIPVDSTVNEYKYALIIGNENYSKHQTGLRAESNVDYAINDAYAFKKYAESTLGVPKDHITYVTDALSSKMKSEIAKLVELSKIESMKNKIEIIFYYAGHGFPDDNTKKGYLVPVDITGSTVTSGIALTDLYKDLSNENVKKASIFLDACFSGGGRNEGLVAARGVLIKSEDEKIENGNLVVFTASSGDQKSLPYVDKGHGMFTYFLLKKLQETKGDISYDELSQYIKNNVEVNSINKNGTIQNPNILVSPQLGEEWKTWTLKN